MGLDKALNGFQKDGDAEGDEEDAIDKSSQRLGALPTVRVVLVVGLLRGNLDGPKPDTEGKNVV